MDKRTKKTQSKRTIVILLLVLLAAWVGATMWLMSGFEECFMCYDVPGDPCFDKGCPCF